MDARSVIDDALEITIVGSFTNVGYAVRRRLFGWSEPAPDALAGRTVLVTGPTSGLGRATADAMADLGARVVLVSRSEEKLAQVSRELADRHGEDRFPYVVADLSSLADARAAVEHVRASEVRLDVLVDSAGAILEERRVTEDGLEATFAIMVVSPFVLITGLLPMLELSPHPGRVISVVSGGMYAQPIDLEDLQLEEREFNGTLAYARAKRASAALVREWSRRLARRSVRVNAMHPGWADTPGLEEALPGFYRLAGPLLRSPAEGIETTVWLAADRDAGEPDGRLFLDRRPRPFDRVPATRLTPADRRRLWDRVVELSGGPDPAPERREG